VLIVLYLRNDAQKRKGHRYSIHTKKQGGACDMRDAETVLGMLRDRGTRGLKVDDLYRQLYNPLLYLRAYGRIYSNDGAMTKGGTSETADGMSLDKIEEIIASLKRGTFRWTPVRRTYIAKKNGKKRPLGLPSFTDKLVQEVIRSLLEALYEPQFSEASHGFRPQRGCHTALSLVQRTWTGCKWFIEGDIRACFDRLDHSVMLSILAQKITDQRFLHLIKHLLQAGYLEDWHYHATYSGSPQGGVVSPILSNIYLDQLDHYIEQELIPRFTQGAERHPNREYARLRQQAVRLKQKGKMAQAEPIMKMIRELPAGDPNDPTYRRLHYVRYADDTLLGFVGTKKEAEEIKDLLRTYLHETLKLELSEEKTLITHAATQAARFLGYEIVGGHCNSRLFGEKNKPKRVKRRRLNGTMRLRVPADVIERKRREYQQRGKPLRRMTLAPKGDYTILKTYQDEYRGLYQYYQYAGNVSWLHTLHWDMYQSVVHTLAAKYQTRCTTILKRFKTTIETPHGVRTCLQVTTPRQEGKKPLVATFGGIPLKQNKQAVLVDRFPTPIRYEQKEVVRRLERGICELCEVKDERCVVHHTRKLVDLERMGKKRPLWAQIMLKRRRKTLIVCQSCHHIIHQE
jgi:group II intron reverse transcriptase/maturase